MGLSYTIKNSTKIKEIKESNRETQFLVYLRNSIFTNTLKAVQKILVCSSKEVWSNIQIDIYCSSVYKPRSPTENKFINRAYYRNIKILGKGTVEIASKYLIINSKTSHVIFGISMSLASFSCITHFKALLMDQASRSRFYLNIYKKNNCWERKEEQFWLKHDVRINKKIRLETKLQD